MLPIFLTVVYEELVCSHLLRHEFLSYTLKEFTSTFSIYLAYLH